MNGMKKVVAAAVGFTAVAGVVALIGWKIPAPAWSTDIELVQAQIIDVDLLATQEALETVNLRYYQNLREQGKFRADRLPLPNSLLREQVDLETKQRRLQARLKRLQ